MTLSSLRTAVLGVTGAALLAGAPGEGAAPPAPPGINQSIWDGALRACRSLAPAPPTR